MRRASRIFASSFLIIGFGCASPQSTGGTGGTNGSGTGGTNGSGTGGTNTTTGAGGTNTTSGAGGTNTTSGAGGSHTGGSTGAAGSGPACTPSDTQLVTPNGYYCTSASLGLQGAIY